jgi:16S rRNA (cytosine967-C5)-methyltransferase
MTALDVSAERVERIRENLARLGLEADVRVADAGQEGAWCETGPFDRILLDVPCSGTGVIRRHPDIKLLRRADDLPALVAGQDRLLDALWSRLRPGGRLVYSTCSVIRAENADRVAAFLERRADARAEPISADWGFPDGPGRQILPGETGMDGFYYACMHKSDDGPIM